MKIIQCTRSQFVDAMLTLKAPHPALYPYLSVFAAIWDSTGNADYAAAKAKSLISGNSTLMKTFARRRRYDRNEDNPAQFTLQIKLPHAADGFHEACFETDGVGHYEVRYHGDDLDHLFPHIAP